MTDEDKARLAEKLRLYKSGIYGERANIGDLIEYVENCSSGAPKAFALTCIGMAVNTTIELTAKMIEND